jgi:hypothetical protein
MVSTSNMTNSQGLFTDGYHIRGWRGRTNGIGSGKCDVRNEMVYTTTKASCFPAYEDCGKVPARSYLEDGHALIRNVIAATGWHIKDAERRQRWAGLGSNGILEEACDASGVSQDGRRKGIFFHHLASLRATADRGNNCGITSAAGRDEWRLHVSCKEYVPWIAHNARAAYATRNEDGVFGMVGPGPQRGVVVTETTIEGTTRRTFTAVPWTTGTLAFLTVAYGVFARTRKR